MVLNTHYNTDGSSTTEETSRAIVDLRKSRGLYSVSDYIRAWACIYRSMPVGIALPVPNKPYGFCTLSTMFTLGVAHSEPVWPNGKALGW